MHPQLFIQIKREGQPGEGVRMGGGRNKAAKQNSTRCKTGYFDAKPQNFQNTEATLGFHDTAPLMSSADLL